MISKSLVAIAALSLSVLSAQPGRGPRGDGSGTPPTAEQMVERRVERLTTLLSLTPSQVTTITSLYTAEQTAVAAQRTAMETARQALQDAVKAGIDAQIDTAASEVGRLNGLVAAIHGKTQAKFLAALTAEQRTKLESLGEGRGPGMGAMGGISPRGGGFPRF